MELRMKESYGEGVTHHTGPESCAVDRKVKGEALTGVRTGQPLSGEIILSGTPTLLSEAEGHTEGGVTREPFLGPAPSKTLRTCGNSMRGNREIPQVPSPDGGDGRTGKAKSHTPVMNACGKSDACIVPKKLSNKDRVNRPAETVEERRAIKGNVVQPAIPRTQSRKSMSPGLQRVRTVARKDKDARFTSLLHHVTVTQLKDSYLSLKRQAAAGVDGVTWTGYQENLDQRLASLHNRVHGGTYRALPSRRVYIPKPDGRKRPLGIAALEDKIVQHAVGKVLSAIYEEDFLGFSYGFRPERGQHDALDALFVGLTRKKVNWVLDADIKGFFDAISHEWMQRFVEHRVADPRVLRLLRKWLRAGVSEDGQWSRTRVGTPQGAVASPLLANIYLHYALDLWVNQWRKTKATGDVIVVRYADDFVIGFQHRHEADAFLAALKQRLENFALSLHPEKTRLIEFGRFARENRVKKGKRKPETFDFLGFTHICTITRKKGWFHICRKTVKKRLRATLSRVKAEIRFRMHERIGEVGAWLQMVVRGYYRYHAVSGNLPAMNTFRTEIIRYWFKTLRRRGQKRRMNWERFGPIVKRWIPIPTVQHPYPNVRFYAKYPR
jgi:RNA-directed DNA polymerase